MSTSKPLTLFCLHFLGGSARDFDGVAQRLGTFARVIGVDLAGFGTARDVDGYPVARMAEAVTTGIRQSDAGQWMLVGHSMGAKVAALIARHAEDGVAGLAGLVGLVSLAGSPPGPEPMADSKRHTMLGWFHGDETTSRREAESYIGENVAAPLVPQMTGRLVDDVLHAHPAAWRAWLTSGSREDLRPIIGRLKTPALILAGSDDEGLGETAQRRHALPHYSNAVLRTLTHTGHLLPLERPDAVADLLKKHGEACEGRL